MRNFSSHTLKFEEDFLKNNCVICRASIFLKTGLGRVDNGM